MLADDPAVDEVVEAEDDEPQAARVAAATPRAAMDSTRRIVMEGAIRRRSVPPSA